MGKNDWARTAESEELALVGVSRHRGRGWKVLSGLLIVSCTTFAVAYYVPLYRAHARLRSEYKANTIQAANFRKQLVDTIATLNENSNECSKLRSEARQRDQNTSALASQMDRLERNLQGPLKKFRGKGRLEVERSQETLRVTLAAPTLVATTGGDLTEAGKKALCALGTTLKDARVHVVVRGLGVIPATTPGAAWQMAATRAGNAAQLLSKDCGVDSSHIEVAVSPAAPTSNGAAVAIEITPAAPS